LIFFRKVSRKALDAVIKWDAGWRRQTSYRERSSLLWLPKVLLVTGLVLLIADYFNRLGGLTWLSSAEGLAAYEFWIGTKSVLDVSLGLMTTVIAVTAAYLALRSYRVNQRAAVANRYQKESNC
jgi:hypothetical protein